MIDESRSDARSGCKFSALGVQVIRRIEIRQRLPARILPNETRRLFRLVDIADVRASELGRGSGI